MEGQEIPNPLHIIRSASIAQFLYSSNARKLVSDILAVYLELTLHTVITAIVLTRVTVFFKVTIISPPPLGQEEHLDLLWFPINKMHVGICPCLCRTLFTQYFLQFFVNGFQIL